LKECRGIDYLDCEESYLDGIMCYNVYMVHTLGIIGEHHVTCEFNGTSWDCIKVNVDDSFDKNHDNADF